ncbi:MAG: hypothetical protein COU06_01175 [Candidatus Harrisonbacteria bacterium CG10_big_fil_rev_8_21_14_0_10_38_8]|uniref:Uncharacterized protein n=1 Tax=Candidatus Harrisonbacteria bacterium CG10_big_fil_rev_8_21_14_0_10_38_8 TaxID=1974582 RepID=A0A2M6WK96_9BACT|nr:MAG: hypothetical protein COU06_01175 [Candidatus Harrisonbacteria bacterium CG10_big_fil_rev_8_21_14_0_10_38_8]
MKNIITKELSDQYFKLPKNLRDWLASDTSTNVVISLNTRFKMIGEGEISVIPRLVALVVLKVIPPEKFTYELSGELPFLKKEEVENIAFQIKDRILRPVKALLRENYGIASERLDTKLPEPEVLKARVSQVEKEIKPEIKPEAEIVLREDIPKPKITDFKAPVVEVKEEEIKVKAPLVTEEAKVTNPQKPFTLEEE